MPSTNLANEQYTLTSLPLSVLTRILGYLCPYHPFRTRTNRLKPTYYFPFRDPPVTLSLDCGDTLTVPLPSELRSPALASPILASAAANLLGERVSFLTQCNTNGQLSEWVQAFAPYVKALSTQDPFITWWTSDLEDTESELWVEAFDRRVERSLQLFDTLILNGVKLQVLDLVYTPFLDMLNHQDDLLASLCATLESSSATLRELAIPVFDTSDICDRALETSTLNKLDVLTVKRWGETVEGKRELTVPPFVRIIRAINGHADRSRNLTTLRELRFYDFHVVGYNDMNASDRSSSVFSSIRTLRLARYTDEYIQDENHLFILLFTNLECLFWNISPEESSKLFLKVCKKVPKVHICGSRWFTKSRQVGSDDHFADKCPLFEGMSSDNRAFGSGAMRTVFAGGLSQRGVRNIMKHCPSLENVSVHVSKRNVRAIRKLVEKCQNMKCIELVIFQRRHGKLDPEDWLSVSRIVPKSHKNLCQVAIQPLNCHTPAIRNPEAVFRCLEAVTKALGERARRLAFRMVFRTRWGLNIIERMTSLLSTCIQHTRKLESLEVKTKLHYRDASDYDSEQGKRISRRFEIAENRLMDEIQSLRMVDLGGIYPGCGNE